MTGTYLTKFVSRESYRDSSLLTQDIMLSGVTTSTTSEKSSLRN